MKRKRKMKHVSVRADTQKISKLAVQRFRSRSIILKRKMFYFLESYMKPIVHWASMGVLS